MSCLYWEQNPAGDPLVDCVIEFGGRKCRFTFEYGDAFALQDPNECLGYVLYKEEFRPTLISLLGQDTFDILEQIVPVP